MSLTEFEALTTLVAGPDAFQAQMQRENCYAFDRLPRNRQGYPSDDAREAEARAVAERAGFVFGEVLDDLFISVTPPEGWMLRRTDHHMYSDIVDHLGRVRGQQMYKAAFYDRDASFHLRTRYGLDQVKPKDWWERSNPARLFTTEEVEVLVDNDGNVVERLDGKGVKRKGRRSSNDPWLGRFDSEYPHHWNRSTQFLRTETREFRTNLPDDQQPVPRGYDVTQVVRDFATGAVVQEIDTYYHPTANEDARWAFVSEERDTAVRAKAIAWLDANRADWCDPVAYWNEA